MGKAQEQAQRWKMGSYHYYDDETRTKIAKYLCDYGNKVLLESSLLGLGMLLQRVQYAI